MKNMEFPKIKFYFSVLQWSILLGFGKTTHYGFCGVKGKQKISFYCMISSELKPGFPEICGSYQKFQRDLSFAQNFVQGHPDLWSHIESTLDNAIVSEISANMNE